MSQDHRPRSPAWVGSEGLPKPSSKDPEALEREAKREEARSQRDLARDLVQSPAWKRLVLPLLSGKVEVAQSILLDMSKDIGADLYRAQGAIGAMRSVVDQIEATSKWTFEDEGEEKGNG